jgi:hypothetical protein
MKYLETEEEKKSFAITSVIFDSICSVLLLRINFFPPPPENGIAINFGTTGWVWQRSTDRTHQSAPIATAAKQTAASNQDILSQDIEEAVVIKQTKKTQPSKKRRRKRLKNKENPQPSKAPLMHCQAS